MSTELAQAWQDSVLVYRVARLRTVFLGQVGPLQEDGAVVQPDWHGLPAEELEVVGGPSREEHADLACADEPLAPDAAELDRVGAEEQGR